MRALFFRFATDKDIDALWAILQDGIATIGELGITQWQFGYPNRDVVARDISRGHALLCEDPSTGEILGGLALVFDAEADYNAPTERWLTPNPAEGEKPVYAVIHRNAIARSAARQGIMKELFAEAERIAREAGRASMRVDTHPQNVNMRGLLESLGYTCCGDHPLTPNGGEPPEDLVRVGYEKLL